MIPRRPVDCSFVVAALIALGACHPTVIGGGSGGSMSSSDASSGSASSGSSASSSTGSGGGGGAGGGASAGGASSSGGAGGAASSSSASSSSASSSSASSSSSGTGGGSGGGVALAWTKAIPATGTFSFGVAGISARTPDRLFIGGNFQGGSLSYAGKQLDNLVGPQSIGYFVSMDGAGNPVSNAQFGDNAYDYTARLFATDAASNLFVSGDDTGAMSFSFLPVQRVGAPSWLQKPGGLSNLGSSSPLEMVTDVAGNLLLHVSTPMQGADFGGGLQTGHVVLKLDAATGGFLWNKPSPGSSMRRDGAGNLFFVTTSPSQGITKYDANLAPIWTKTFTGSAAMTIDVASNGEIALVGKFYAPIDVGCGPVVGAPIDDNIVVAHLDALGNCLYSKLFYQGGSILANLAVGITATGEVVTVGTSTLKIAFGSDKVLDPGTFVFKLDAAGAYVSSTSVPATQLFSAIDAQGGVYLVGSDFDAGVGPILGNVPGIAVAKLVP